MYSKAMSLLNETCAQKLTSNYTQIANLTECSYTAPFSIYIPTSSSGRAFFILSILVIFLRIFHLGLLTGESTVVSRLWRMPSYEMLTYLQTQKTSRKDRKKEKRGGVSWKRFTSITHTNSLAVKERTVTIVENLENAPKQDGDAKRRCEELGSGTGGIELEGGVSTGTQSWEGSGYGYYGAASVQQTFEDPVPAETSYRGGTASEISGLGMAPPPAYRGYSWRK